MKLGYCIIYVSDVRKTLDFYEKAFDVKRGYVHEDNVYGELETGETKLAFVSETCVENHGLKDYTRNRPDTQPSAFEIAFVTKDVDGAYAHAVKSGAMACVAPVDRPWGQRISYVRDLNGVLVEICSPVGEI